MLSALLLPLSSVPPGERFWDVQIAGPAGMRSPIFFIYFCARDTSKVGQKLFSIGINRIDREFRHDPAAARCDVKSKKTLYRY